MQVEPVQEEQNPEPENANEQQPAQIPDGGLDDDNESAATEVAEAPGGDVYNESQLQVVDLIWAEYDKD